MPKKQTVLKAMVILSDDDGKNGEIHSVDVVEFKGQAWLVPEWIDNPSEKVTTPVRILLLYVLRHSRGKASPQFVVHDPIPKSVFAGTAPPKLASQYVVVEAPDIRLPIPDVMH